MSQEQTTPEVLPEEDEDIVQAVKDRYGKIATGKLSGCCGPAPSCCESPATIATELGYQTADLDLLPDGTNLGLGCGAPLIELDLRPGEVTVDLGSGAGVDVLIATRHVGPEGRAIGIDMTPEMIAKAEMNAEAAGARNAEFRLGRLEELPVESATVDAITSNCVINLVPDKQAVFVEIARVLRPGGRLAISDVVLDGELPDAVSDDLLAYVGCVAGAIGREEYFSNLAKAGLGRVEVRKDVDFLELTAGSLPEEVTSILDRSGIAVEDLRGKVRSITYVAYRD